MQFVLKKITPNSFAHITWILFISLNSKLQQLAAHSWVWPQMPYKCNLPSKALVMLPVQNWWSCLTIPFQIILLLSLCPFELKDRNNSFPGQNQGTRNQKWSYNRVIKLQIDFVMHLLFVSFEGAAMTKICQVIGNIKSTFYGVYRQYKQQP